MSKQLIQPWDGDTPASSSKTNVDTYIPPAIEKLAQAVSKKYAMKVYDRKLITSKPDKGGAIWKIDTDKGPRSLKLLHREPARSLFSVGAQEYLVKNKNGLVVDRPEDPKAFVKPITKLLSNKKLRREMGKNGRHLALKQFQWKRVAKEVEAVWEP